MRVMQEAHLRPLMLALLLVPVVAAAGLFIHNSVSSPLPWINHDLAFHGYLGVQMLQGKKLYVDIHDSNPPGVQFLLEGLVEAAHLLGLSEFMTIHLFVLILGAAGLLLIYKSFHGAHARESLVLVGLAYLLILLRCNFGNHIYPLAPQLPYDFAEREQLFALLFVPYLFWRLERGAAELLAYPCFILLGFVSMFKPYWAPLVVAVELLVPAARKPWTVRTALGLGMLLPFALLLLHSPAAFVAFVTEIIPLHLRGDYGHYGMPAADFITSSIHLRIALLGLVFLVCWWVSLRQRILPWRSLLLLLLIPAATYLSVWHQYKFWSYHAIPLFAALVAFTAYLLPRIGERLKAPARTVLVTGAGLVLAVFLGLAMHNLRTMLEEAEPLGSYLVPVVRDHNPVMYFSMNVETSYATLLLHHETVGPWSVHFMLPGILAIRDPQERRIRLEGYAQEISAFIERDRPSLLVFAPYRQGLPPGVGLHDLLAEHGVVPRADYVRIPERVLMESDPRLEGWIVYQRLDQA